MPPQRRVNRLQIISYHYSDFGELRLESEGGEPSRLGQNGDSEDTNPYLQSTAQLYAQRNRGLRPRMQEPQTAEVNAGEDPDAEETLTTFSPFVISRVFRRLLNCFEQNYFLMFPNIPCAYCGLLSSY
jgi:hypothetical protein